MGFSITYSIQSLPFGGKEITAHLGTILPVTLADSAFRHQGKFCPVVLDPLRVAEQRAWKEQLYTLLDRQVVRIGVEAFSVLEPMFTLFLGLGRLVRRGIEAADGSLLQGLWGGIVLVGLFQLLKFPASSG